MIRSQKVLSEASHPAEQLSQSDRMLLRYAAGRDWVEGNQRVLYYVLIAVVAIGGGLFWLAANRKANNERAATYLSRVVGYYQQNDLRKAIDGDLTRHVQGDPLYGLRYIATE